jgi:NAD(P)-dependent dehydrogenase (short-subunit alcohol dehydrogenase family)
MGSTTGEGTARVALVTGGRRGIGRGIAWALAESGFDVALADLVHDDAAAETLQGVAGRGGRARFFTCDVADLDAHAALLGGVQEGLGPIDCLVNSAGISVAQRGDLLDASPESFDRVLDVNLRGPFFLTQRVGKAFLADRRPDRYRSIINISSANAFAASLNRGEYCLSKAAITMATRLFAARLAEGGVAVFELRPGVIRTDMTAVAAADYDRRIAEGLSPIARWGTPEDVGRAAAALASGALSFSTGDAIHVDGGFHIQRL